MSSISFDDIAIDLHQTAVEKGFWPEDVDDIFITKQLMMIVSEAVEVMEAIRKDKGDDAIADEMADIIIRTLDLYAGLAEHGYVMTSLDYALSKKANFNKERPERHGVRF
jgi:NTP pyrophosphatase (non-canonical NTP hydrolase)